MAFKDLDALLEGENPQQKPEQGGPRVLVVDDDPAMRKSLDGLLRTSYQVVLAATAREAVAAANDDTCVVILDVKMKDHDGFWACTEIRKKYPTLPVIFYSAYQDVKDPFEIINEFRPFGYLVKDGEPRRLLDTVKLAVRLHKRRQANNELIERVASDRRSDRPPKP